MQQSLAFFGGSFDPPHLGHLHIIESALKELRIDKLLVVPNFLNPFKDCFCFAPNLRLEWLRILCQSLPDSLNNKLEVLDYEICQNSPTPTYQTLQFVRQNYSVKGKIYLLIGADNVKSLPRWQNFAKLKKSVEFVIIPRKGFEIPQGFRILPFCELDISSTQIRNMLFCKEDMNLSRLIPQPILELILKELNCKKTDRKPLK